MERLGEFVKQGVADLGNARVEARGEAGYVFFTHLDSLNSEDDETCGPWETAVDLVLLHPELRIGVLRGDPVRPSSGRSREPSASGWRARRATARRSASRPSRSTSSASSWPSTPRSRPSTTAASSSPTTWKDTGARANLPTDAGMHVSRHAQRL